MGNRSIRAYLTVSISVILSIILFKFFIKNVDIHFLWSSIKTANIFFIGISGLLLLMSHYLRAFRWIILLRPIQSDINIASSFAAILIGTMSNFVVPHVGEVIRCSVLKKMERTGIEFSIGTVIAERLFDALFLSILILFGLILNINSLDLPPINAALMDNSLVFKLFLVVVVLVLLSIVFKKRLLANVSESVNQKIIDLKKGVTSIKQVKHSNAFIFLSIAIWTLYFFATYCLIKSILPTQYISFKVVLTVLIMSSIGWAGPTQGGIGMFHILVSKALIINGFDENTSNMMSLFLHTLFSIFDLTYGVLATCFLYFFSRPSNRLSDLRANSSKKGPLSIKPLFTQNKVKNE
jgi:glycosyltransferase 2 family protein